MHIGRSAQVNDQCRLYGKIAFFSLGNMGFLSLKENGEMGFFYSEETKIPTAKKTVSVAVGFLSLQQI
jgi:hypothetical protein